MKHQRSVHSVARVIVVVALILVTIASAGAQRQVREATVAGRDVTIQVTVHPHNDRARAAAAQLQPDDFTVREEKRPQRIISVKRSGEAPLILAALIQDDLVSRVNNEIKGAKEFIRRLPEGSRRTSLPTWRSPPIRCESCGVVSRRRPSTRMWKWLRPCAASTRNRWGGG